MYHFPFLLLLARLGCKYIRIVAKNMEYNFTSVKLGAATQLSKYGRRFMLWLESYVMVGEFG